MRDLCVAATGPPAWFHHIPEIVPALPLATAVMTARVDSTIGKLNDKRRAVAMLRIPRANPEDPSQTTLPCARTSNVQPVILYPRFEIKRTQKPIWGNVKGVLTTPC